MTDHKQESIERLRQQVDYLRSRLNRLRGSRRVLMALLETVDLERRNAISRLEAENRRLRRRQRADIAGGSTKSPDHKKVVWFSRNDVNFGE
ncbi:MAG: hypothetical protein PHC60_05880 [Heliobacteriaceae bacterium]|nr:hypothetical protein [Heliobacteriaceae bacterium]MDD4587894.1 hypothetical protein [Heliobacteriaceae bacterium]